MQSKKHKEEEKFKKIAESAIQLKLRNEQKAIKDNENSLKKKRENKKLQNKKHC